MNENQQVFRGSIPHLPDINKLKNAFPVSSLLPGVIIDYERVETVLQTHRNSSRFRSITLEWRKEIESSHNIVISTMHGKSFYVANDSQILNIGDQKLRTAATLAKRSRQITSCANVNNLDAAERERLSKMQILAGNVMLAASTKKPKALPDV